MAQVTLREYLQEIEDTISSGHIDDASKQCQHVLVQFPESLEVQRLLGEVYLAQGQMEDAQQALDWILTNDPENVIAYCDRALISERLSDFDTALDCYQQAYELSRGNRDIRQQFNMLSAKAGQQGFMFSRAGLARLYMRGGLLSQAMQEWDAVLSVSPDRLDARTGLLETYWREGLYDEAEQLALEVLQDVPGCVKALLLLAHIIAPKDMLQAKEYVRRAELLDPDLLMAQELFEDMMMSQTGHPFLKLLQKAPVVLEEKQTPVSVAFDRVPASEEAVLVPEALLQYAPTPASNSPFEWSSLDTWSGEGEFVSPTQNGQPPAEAPVLPTWSHDIFAINDAWTLPVQPQETSQTQHADDVQYEAWSQNASHEVADVSPLQESPAWGDMGHLSALSTDAVWQHEQETNQPEPAWMSAAAETASPASPAWLSMLTQDEQQPRVSDTAQEPKQASVETPVAASHHQVAEEPIVANEVSDSSWQDTLQTSLNVSPDDEEPFFFGPEWLKSLGATEIGADAPEKTAEKPVEPQREVVQPQPVSVQTPVASQPPIVVAPEPVQPPEPEPAFESYTWAEPVQAPEPEPTLEPYAWSEPVQASAAEPTFDAYEWSKQLAPEQPEQTEQTLVNTLENLEHSLRSQGFVPLEPKSLSTIAQSQEQMSDVNEPSYQPQAEIYREELYQQPYDNSTLTSALAQLGNLVSPYAQPPYPVAEPFVPAAHESASQPLEEPTWMSGLRSVPAPRAEVPYDNVQQYVDPIETPAKTTFDIPIVQPHMPPTPPRSIVSEPAYVQTRHVEPVQQRPAFEPTPVDKHVEMSPVAPVARVDAFFESELETTMKRPAVRLQAMAQRGAAPAPSSSASQQQISVSTGAGRSNEQRPATGGGKDGSQSSRERLVKGYQHQLVGDYDEAMQEYRVIIKSEPELLGEVVSNVRALLNLAPKYSAGYRVLGDAYMRQGEYLQAMESYNKALTMAKKAKV